MKFKIAVLAGVAVVFWGSLAFGADAVDTAVKDGQATAAVTPDGSDSGRESVPNNVVDRDGTWVGVIEDIQDIDTETAKKAEWESKWRLPGKNGQVGLLVGSILQVATGGVLTAFGGASWGGFFDNWGGVRNDPHLFLITFIDELDRQPKKIAVFAKIQWNAGDKIKVVKDGDKASVELIEMGELSRYAAEKEAERAGKR